MILASPKNLFDEKSFLSSYDLILSNSEHYVSILKNHVEALKHCESILDLGCGSGASTIEFLKHRKKVTALDKSLDSLEFLKEKAIKIKLEGGLKCIQGDMTDLVNIPSNSYEGVNSMIAAHLVKNFEGHIKESYRVLKSEGTFVITARDINGNQSLLVDIAERSLKSKGLFNKLRDEFDEVCSNLLMTANNRSKSLMTKEEAKNILIKNGFRDIQEIENKSQGVMYTFKAEKV
ncbi:class I SAM-dependent methyltransferase [Tenacibaculum agarivorans]|uniref:class I SAM-dependent methyltransferase n=1 Tax=Tenacibaculum agarivorans TaxID=1908389 RepID=UPI00094BAFE3|nr:class I SAM-dependent methyltransferase [Tenacibaculum agarivorans]